MIWCWQTSGIIRTNIRVPGHWTRRVGQYQLLLSSHSLSDCLMINKWMGGWLRRNKTSNGKNTSHVSIYQLTVLLLPTIRSKMKISWSREPLQWRPHLYNTQLHLHILNTIITSPLSMKNVFSFSLCNLTVKTHKQIFVKRKASCLTIKH